MKKSGFTLIELLAVIVVLALIALIVTPLITGIIAKSKESADKRSAEAYIESGENYFSKSLINPDVENLLDTNVIDKLELSGQKGTGSLIVNHDGKIEMALTINNKCYVKEYNQNKEHVMVVNKPNCEIYKENILNGATPVYSDGMIPVTIEDDGTVKKADITSEWYNYENHKWANIVLVKEEVREKYQLMNYNEVIDSGDILAYYVWIPRFKYQIFSSSTPKEINIEFENKNNLRSLSTNIGDFYTHPAFNFGGKEMNGIWVGKFETTGSADKPTILPNVSSLRNETISTFFTITQKFNNNSFYGVNNDAHISKINEWGAISYLSQSKYGLCNSGVCPKIRRNNNSDFITGSSANKDATIGYSPTSSSTNEFGTTSSVTTQYNKSIGYFASTTQNITGVYDMAGGAWEYVMADLVDRNGIPYSGRHNICNSGYNGPFGSLITTDEGADNSILKLESGIELPDRKYYDLFKTSNINTACDGVCYGSALTETYRWYSSYDSFPDSGFPWIVYGGEYGDGIGANIFSHYSADGFKGNIISFRTVLSS